MLFLNLFRGSRNNIHHLSILVPRNEINLSESAKGSEEL